MAEHNLLGAEGENIALKHLEKNGYKILARNWKHQKEEIDIIAEKNNELAIIEVKTRRGNFFGEPEEFVSKTKQKQAPARGGRL